jgi:coniferyl-aldehyde dehydrogenase
MTITQAEPNTTPEDRPRGEHVGQDDLPFGGVGESGMGKYHGIEGFRTLSHPKGIYVQGRWNSINLLHAPCGKRADALLNFFLR